MSAVHEAPPWQEQLEIHRRGAEADRAEGVDRVGPLLNEYERMRRADEAARTAQQSNALGLWKGELAVSGSGYLGDERNIMLALRRAPELKGLLRYNEFALHVELTGSPPWREAKDGEAWTETDDTQLTAWLQAQGLKVRGTRAIADSVAVVARDLRCHPVRDYLNGLKWDGVPRVKMWARTYLHAEGSDEYLAAIGPKFLISAVARVMQPGCQADHVLVLEGRQHLGKTKTARALAVRSEWFAGSLPDIHSKDAPLQLVSRWIIEISELKAIRTSQVEAVKAFITENIDTFRPPYGRRTAQFPRQCVFIGTTNESEYLRDRTGNRRYWPLRCRKIELTRLEQDVPQIWAEAVQLYRSGALWYLTGEEVRLAAEQQSERVHVSELEADVAEYLGRQGERDDISVRDVLVFGLHIDPDKAGYTETARKLGPAVAEAMEHAGWRRRGRIGGGMNKRTVYERVDKVDKR